MLNPKNLLNELKRKEELTKMPDGIVIVAVPSNNSKMTFKKSET